MAPDVFAATKLGAYLLWIFVETVVSFMCAHVVKKVKHVYFKMHRTR